MERYLAYVAKQCREVGWRSRKATEFGGTSTSDHALKAYLTKASDKTAALRPTDEDVATAAAARRWVVDTYGARDATALSDYEYNLVTAVRPTFTRLRHAGLVASAIAAYLRATSDLQTAGAPKQIDEYFGVVGKRVDFSAFLVSVTTYDGDYGTKYLHRFVTSFGHMLRKDLDVARQFRGTIKAHDNKRGRRETQLSRVVETTSPAAPPKPAAPSPEVDEAAHFRAGA